jgi:hypothetical protein
MKTFKNKERKLPDIPIYASETGDGIGCLVYRDQPASRFMCSTYTFNPHDDKVFGPGLLRHIVALIEDANKKAGL